MAGPEWYGPVVRSILVQGEVLRILGVTDRLSVWVSMDVVSPSMNSLNAIRMKVVEFACGHGCITMYDAVRSTNGNRTTPTQYLRARVDGDCVDLHGTALSVGCEFR